MVEDAVNGVKAALAAGCSCLTLATTFSESELRAAGATTIIPDLSYARPSRATAYRFESMNSNHFVSILKTPSQFSGGGVFSNSAALLR